MKIILSRKGFDSSPENGGVPSPILPSGAMYSLPIPERASHYATYARCYGDIRMGEYTAGKFAADLTRNRIQAADRAHLDPDLNAASIARPEGWRPLFGQEHAAESHLRNQGIEAGDVFLFYGWFREVEVQREAFRYRRGARDLHVLFGWLQVESRYPSSDILRLPSWTQTHPHYQSKAHKHNSIYLAADRLKLRGVATDLPGAGVFSHYRDALCLTAKGASRSIWQLPEWLHPEGKASSLSYHGNPLLWTKQEGSVRLKSVAKGQEFVLDCDHFPEATEWLEQLIHSPYAAGQFRVQNVPV
ncbi:MAG TPA: hypothetical protein VKU00_07920 [Chthonomonadaceae bacterium]|nr:hypothetical protein [Chthonomonadaceae bacterium]